MVRSRLLLAACAFLFGSSETFGQSQGIRPAFEVASIKPTPKERLYRLKRECTGREFVAAGMPLSFIIAWSYGFGDSRILGLPDWVNDWDLAYDFDAKSSEPMSEGQCKQMVQSLLADRFAMAGHRETRMLPVYALTVAKNGPKLREVAADAGPGVRINGARFQSLSDNEPPKGLSMGRLAGTLSDHPVLRRPVIDNTGLTGIYSFDLTFSMKEGDDRPSIFTAVQEQLGLKLESVKAPLEVLVVDHIEKASAN
jgi:uncharacterized protein (TIGR03435 family)